MRTSHRQRCATALACLSAVAALAACGDDEILVSSPSMQSVAGAYTATTFSITAGGTTGGSTSDVLTQGGSLQMSLAAGGSTTGRLVIPTAVAGAAVDASMAGSWTLRGDTVRFTQAADTFVRDTPFLVRGNTLVGDRTFGTTRIQVTLRKP
jgi:hypothetical protein